MMQGSPKRPGLAAVVVDLRADFTTVQDALTAGCRVIIEELCPGISEQGSRTALAEMAEAGAVIRPRAGNSSSGS